MMFGLAVLNVGIHSQAEEATTTIVQEEEPLGWRVIEDKMFYLDARGNYQTGLQFIDNEIYLFLEDGSLYRGWITLIDKKFYFDEAGIMQRRECLIDGKNYSFLATGEFVSGWYEKNGQTYYKDEYGYDKKGLILVDQSLYYVGDNGLQKGKIVADKIYYTDDTGKIYTGECLINGKKSYFSESGQYLHGWKLEEGKWQYANEAGIALTGLQTIDGNQYYFDENGILLVNTTIGMYGADEQGVLARLPVSVETLDAALDEILEQTGTDIASIGRYVNRTLKYKYMEELPTREEMAVYAINNRRCSCYYYAALTGLLLERAGYETVTIKGKGFVYAEHTWNLVNATRDGIAGWYHVDALKGQYIKKDAEMVAKGFVWAHENYSATP